MEKFARIVTLFVFAMTLLGLSVTASYAGTGCRAGCDCTKNTSINATDQGSHNFADDSFFGQQEAKAQAIRTRDRATARQIQHQNDNGPGMTCFDHAMALTSRLGQLFSDIHPKTKIPAASTRVFGQVTYQNYGADQWLHNALGIVVYPTLSNHADDFAPDSISTALGATSFPFFGTSFMGALNALISGIMGTLNQITQRVNQLNSLWNYFVQIVDALGGNMPTWIITWVPIITNFWNSVIMPMITATIGALMNAVGSVISTVSNMIMGALGSLTNFMNPLSPIQGGGECARIQNLWGTGSSGLGSLLSIAGLNFQTGPLFRALTGSGAQTGNSYFSFAQLVTGAPTTMTSGTIGADLLGELGLGSPALNQGMMTRALNGLTNQLSTPTTSTMPTWSAPQIFAPGTATATLIGAM